MASTPAASPPTPGSYLEEPKAPPGSSNLNSGQELQEVNVHPSSSKENVSIVSNFNNNNVK